MIAVFLSGCVSGIKTGRPDNEGLRESVTRYWTYRMQNDLGNAYYYEHVSYTKLATREFYMGGFGGSAVIIKGFEIQDTGQEGSGPEGYTPVKLKLKLSWPGAPFKVPAEMDNEITDLWTRQEGKWYHIQQKMTGFY